MPAMFEAELKQSVKQNVRCRTFSRAAEMSGNCALSAFCAGNKSSMRLVKSGTSSATNLLMFMSRNVRIMRYTSLLRNHGNDVKYEA